MINKIKATFAAIGSIGVLMLTVSAMLWAFTKYPGGVLEILIISWFTFIGYKAYTFFLTRFDKESEDEQINS
jgi:hypothetical protein